MFYRLHTLITNYEVTPRDIFARQCNVAHISTVIYQHRGEDFLHVACFVYYIRILSQVMMNFIIRASINITYIISVIRMYMVIMGCELDHWPFMDLKSMTLKGSSLGLSVIVQLQHRTRSLDIKRSSTLRYDLHSQAACGVSIVFLSERSRDNWLE